MKKLLFIALSSMVFLPVFSQLKTQPKFNNKITGISVYQNCDPYYHAKDFDFTSFLKDSVYINKKFIPKIPDIKLFFGRSHVVLPYYNYYYQKTIDNMPCLKPEGKFSMPCLKPIGVFPMPCLKPVGVFSSMKNEQPEPLDKYPLLIKD